MSALRVVFRDLEVEVDVEQLGKGGFQATVVGLPGCVAKGKLLDGLELAVRETLSEWLWDRLRRDGNFAQKALPTLVRLAREG